MNLGVTEFILGIMCFVLGLVILFFVPKKMHSANQLEYGSVMMRWALPVILIPLGIGLMVQAVI
jgi:cadmium resistance protein CadD (predicted permease)